MLIASDTAQLVPPVLHRFRGFLLFRFPLTAIFRVKHLRDFSFVAVPHHIAGR